MVEVIADLGVTNLRKGWEDGRQVGALGLGLGLGRSGRQRIR